MAIDVNMFWHGPELGLIHAACIRSFIRNGHSVFMHCYDCPKDLPEGVKLIDAAEIMPLSDLLTHKKRGSITLGADRYRYRLIAAGYGLYADCDMFCIKTIKDSPYILGRQDDRTVNCAFMKLPAQSKLSEMLIESTKDSLYVPPWYKKEKKTYLSILKKLKMGVHVYDLGWGTWGPLLLSHCVKDLGLQSEVSPIDRYYPVHYTQKSLLRDPELNLSNLTTPRTEAIHLWNHLQDKEAPPKGSPLYEMLTC